MVCKNTQVVPSTTSIVYKKKEENSTSLSTLSTQNSTSFLCAKGTIEETSNSLIYSSNNGEMNNINSSDRTVQTHGRPNSECVRQHVQSVTKAGSVGNDGLIQHTLNIGGTPNPVINSSNNGEMLNTQYSQQERDAVEQYQTEQQCLKLLAVVPEEVTESIVIISTDKVCTNCGAIHEEVSIKLAQCTQCGENKLREMDDKMARNNIHDGVSTESLSFMYIEAFQALGTWSIEDGIGNIHKLNKYSTRTEHVKDKAPCNVHTPSTFKIDGYLISNGVKKTDDQKMLAEIDSQICNLANCLNSGIPMLKNYGRKIFRLVREVETETDEVSLIPESKSFHKTVAVNMYNKIIREYGHYTEGTYPDTPEHLSVKSLGSNTWSFQLATKVKKDGKWIPRESVDISAIMNILKGFQNTAWSFPTVELIPKSGYDDSIQSEIIMFGEVNTKMTWVPTGKRSGSPAHLTEYYEEDKMRNQSYQHYNMDELVNQSEFENNSKIDNGTDGVFDGDIISSRWYDMVVGFSIAN